MVVPVVKLDVKAEIPAPAAGRFTDAITDIIRPWSEARGLKADLIRLHREEVAFEIARRAAARLVLQKADTHPIPLKVLVPLLEKGSQEDPHDDYMIGRWAALLASAATTNDSVPRFASILGDLTGSQARLLEYIDGRKYFPWRHIYTTIPQLIARDIRNDLASSLTPEDFKERFARLREHAPVIALEAWIQFPSQKFEDHDIPNLFTMWEREGREGKEPWTTVPDLGVLISLGLIEEFAVEVSGSPQKPHAMIRLCQVKVLGQRFLQAVNRLDAFVWNPADPIPTLFNPTF